MCERRRTHVFLSAPSSLSTPDPDSSDGGSRVSADWTQVDLSWTGGRLHPKGQPPAADGGQTEAEHWADGGQTEAERSASVLEYLNSCFPLTEEPVRPSRALSLQSQYLSTTALSQALVLKSNPRVSSPSLQSSASTYSTTPELFSPNHNTTPPTPTPPVDRSTPPVDHSTPPVDHSTPPVDRSTPSMDCSWSPSPRGGVCVLQDTAQGLLCSQGQEERCSKRAKLCEEFTDQTSGDDVSSVSSVEANATTTLARCVRAGTLYSVLVAVVHPCHLKEIKLKSGECVPLASIVVTDQSGVELKVALWRRAAFWVLTVNPGDVLLITELQVNEDAWRGERLLRSTYNSKLLNLGRVPPPGTLTGSQQVRARSLTPLYNFLTKQRPLLVSLPVPPAQTLSCLPYATIRSLRVNTLVHMLLRVTHTHLSKEWQSEADSRCRSALQPWAVVTVEQPGDQQGALVLWGAAVEWLPRFTRDSEIVWDFRNLLVRDSVTFDLPELHSTSWSSVRALDPTDPRMSRFFQPPRAGAGSSSVELDMKTLLSQKYSGEVELRVHVEAFHFRGGPLSPGPPLVLDGSFSATDVLKLLSGDVTFTGCGRCASELDTDSNGIYRPCYPCLPHTSVRTYYRPAALTLTDGELQMCVQVPPTLMQRLLEAPPDKLRSSAPGSEVKNIEVAARRLHSLFSLPKTELTVTVHTQFMCDENSALLCQDFTLLDFHFPT